MLNTKKKRQDFVMTKEKLQNENAFFELKWKTVQWLMNHKREAMTTLVKEKYHFWENYCKFFDDVRDESPAPIKKARV